MEDFASVKEIHAFMTCKNAKVEHDKFLAKFANFGWSEVKLLSVLKEYQCLRGSWIITAGFEHSQATNIPNMTCMLDITRV